jgi:Asp/Glu/hydantoin racemase
MISTPDVGFHEIRELIDIPVVFITQASLQFCKLLAPNFSFIAANRGILHMLYQVAERYGLKESMIPGGNLDITYLDFEMAYKKPKPILDVFNKVAKEIVSRGATLLFPTPLPLNQWLIEQNVRNIDGATIIDPLGIALKITEMMVDLENIGIKRSKSGAYASPSTEVRLALHKEFGV